MNTGNEIIIKNKKRVFCFLFFSRCDQAFTTWAPGGGIYYCVSPKWLNIWPSRKTFLFGGTVQPATLKCSNNRSSVIFQTTLWSLVPFDCIGVLNHLIPLNNLFIWLMKLFSLNIFYSGSQLALRGYYMIAKVSFIFYIFCYLSQEPWGD